MIKKLQLLLFLLPLFLSAQHQIKGKFSPGRDYEFAIIYKIEADRLVYTVNGKVEQDGRISLPLNDKVVPGMYRFVFDLPEDDNHFNFVYTGKNDVDFSFSKESGPVFSDVPNEILYNYLNKMGEVTHEISSEIQSKGNGKKITELIQKQKSIQKEAEEKADEVTQKYVKALKPYIPEKFENADAYKIYWKSNFFDRFNFADADLQASPFALTLVTKYYYEFVSQSGGSGYRSVIDDIVRETKPAGRKYQKKLLADFWLGLYNQQRTNAANYLAERYLIDLARSENDNDLADTLERIKNTSVGSAAPNFDLKHFDPGKTFYDLKDSEFYLLIFWSTECSHCMAQIPEIYEELQDIPKSKLQVVAVGLEVEDVLWKQKAEEFANFINVLALDDWRDNLVNEYDVRATPTFFILDKNKQILSRPRGKENLMTVIDAIRKYEE